MLEPYKTNLGDLAKQKQIRQAAKRAAREAREREAEAEAERAAFVDRWKKRGVGIAFVVAGVALGAFATWAEGGNGALFHYGVTVAGLLASAAVIGGISWLIVWWSR